MANIWQVAKSPSLARALGRGLSLAFPLARRGEAEVSVKHDMETYGREVEDLL